MTFKIPGARDLKILKGTNWTGDREMPFAVIALPPIKDVPAVNAMKGCRTDWELRP